MAQLDSTTVSPQVPSNSEQYMRGMAGFVKQAMGMYASGTTLRQLIALQAAVSEVRALMLPTLFCAY